MRKSFQPQPMFPMFNLYWLRAKESDVGTPLHADELEPTIKRNVIRAAEGARGPFALVLPFLDERELRRKNEVIGGLEFKRSGDRILPILPPRLLLRTHAARCVFAEPLWTNAPREGHARYYKTWRSVSVALQKAFRAWIPEMYFADVRAYEDRETAHAFLAYEAARVFRPRFSSEFTFDLRDFPQSTETVDLALRMTAFHMQTALGRVEKRLREAGMCSLARRYAPRFYEDVSREVRRNPRTLVNLLSVESGVINAVIDLGSSRTPAAICRFSRTASALLRNVWHKDMRELGLRALDATTEELLAYQGQKQQRGFPKQ